MRVAFISDTHEQERQLTQSLITAKPDVLVHCGDFTGIGRLERVHDFADWCLMLRRKKYVGHVLVVAGNHDIAFDETHPKCAGPALPERARAILHDAGIHYLQDSGCSVTDEHGSARTFWGSPWTPRFFDWAFQIDSKSQDDAIFAQVPIRLDVLVTHGPPLGIMDRTPDGRHVGSTALWAAVERVKPRVHAFGHIHGMYGLVVGRPTLFVNASTCTEAYKPTNPPVVMDI